MATYTHTTLFELDSGSANFKQIETTAIASGIAVGETIDVYYKVTGPNGVVVRNFPLSADATLDTGTPSSAMPLVAMPLATNGDVQEGDYQIDFRFESSLTGTNTLTSNLVLDVKKQSPTDCKIEPLIGVEVDCICNNLTVTDNTTYEDVTLISREITVVPPTIPNEPAPSNIVTTNKSVVVSFGYTNVSYAINLDSLYEHYYDGSGSQLATSSGAVFTVREDLVGTLTKEIKCDLDLCALLSCIDAKTKELIALADSKGGMTKLPAHILDEFLLINKYLNIFNAFYDCGDYTKAQEYYEKLNKLLNCECGCDDGNANTPKPVSNACGGSSGAITAINGSSPVIANNVAGTVTISLDAAFVSLVNNALQSINATNTNGDGFLSDDGSNGVEFDSTPMKWTAWTTLTTASDANPGIDFTGTPIPLRYRYNTFFNQLVVDGSFSIASPSTGMAMTLTTSVLPAAANPSRTTIPIPGFGDNGECVGFLMPYGVSPNQKFAFTPNTNYVAGQAIRVNGTINLNA